MAGYTQGPTLTPPLGKEDHIWGSPNAPAKLVEYGDYQCPYCGDAFPIIKQVCQAMGDRLCFAFRNFPLADIHQYALQAAEAAEAAGAQGKFWQMHDMLFENQPNLNYGHLQAYARLIGLDLERFERELANHTYLPRIREDFNSGIRSGVQGTPTFFVNGVRYAGMYDPQSLMHILGATATVR